MKIFTKIIVGLKFTLSGWRDAAEFYRSEFGGVFRMFLAVSRHLEFYFKLTKLLKGFITMYEVNNYGLRACPCCGEFIAVVLRGDRFGNVCAYCTRCGLSTKFYDRSVQKKTAARKAADAWNMRRPPRYADLNSKDSE